MAENGKQAVDALDFIQQLSLENRISSVHGNLVSLASAINGLVRLLHNQDTNTEGSHLFDISNLLRNISIKIASELETLDQICLDTVTCQKSEACTVPQTQANGNSYHLTLDDIPDFSCEIDKPLQYLNFLHDRFSMPCNRDETGDLRLSGNEADTFSWMLVEAAGTIREINEALYGKNNFRAMSGNGATP